MKSKTTAYILWFFLGWAGAHKFYLGKKGMGVAYLLTFSCLGVGWLIDVFTLSRQVDAVNAESGGKPGAETSKEKSARIFTMVVGSIGSIFLLLLIIGAIVGGDTPVLEYRVISERTLAGNRPSIDVEIPHPYRDEDLRAISRDLRYSEGRSRAETMYVAYFLPGMEIDHMAWATGHYDPDLEVAILGSSYEGYLAGRHAADDPGVIGVWIQLYAIPADYIAIKETTNGYIIEVLTSDGPWVRPLERDSSDPNRFFEPDNNHGEFFLIDRNGDLESWDDDGLIARHPRIEPET